MSNSLLAQLSDTMKAAIEDVKAGRDVAVAKEKLIKSMMTLAASDLSKQHVQNPDIDKQLKVSIGRSLMTMFGKKPDFGEPIKNMAKEYFGRFHQKDLTPRPLASAPGVEEDVEPITPNSGIVDRQAIVAMKEEMMRGMHLPFNTSGMGAAMVRDSFPVTSSKAYGHNNLTPGQWWPFRACLRRDGAHASSMAGIYGSGGGGAMAIISNGGSGYEAADVDYGDVMEYSGSHGDGASTRYLQDSLNSEKPVRVIRGSRVHRWGPEIGFRYDGLYEVVDKKDGKNSTSVFTLHRLPEQESLASIMARSPSPLEKAAYKLLETGKF